MSRTLELAGAAAGVGLVLVAILARRHTRRRPVALVRSALLDPDPAKRRAAVFLAAEEGLRPYVDILVERARNERERPVLDALAEAVARNQWEPADSQQVVELRLWAQTQLSHYASNGHGSHTGQVGVLLDERPPAVAAPRAAGPTGPMPAPLAARPQDDRSRSSADRSGNGHRTERGRTAMATATAPVPERADPVTGVPTIVTGAGGPAGVAVIRSLRKAGHRVVAVDVDSLAVGLRLAHAKATVPRSDDPTFIDALCRVAAATGARALISTVAEELVTLAESQARLEQAGLATWLPEPGAVNACLDKWRFAQLVEAAGLATPKTNLGSGDGVPGTWVVKPRYGRGSRLVYMVDRPDELQWVLWRVPEPIVQTRLSGREFTVDVLVDRRGKLCGAVPRWRLETKAGISTRGRTFEHPELVKAVGQLLGAVGLQGPANVQGFIGDDGAPSFVEVNPRFSGGLPLSLAAGADLVGEYLRGMLGEQVRPQQLHYRPGLTMIRHLEELFE